MRGDQESGRDVSGAEPFEEGIAALIEDRNADDPDQIGENPAGNAGADSGGSDPVRVDPSSESSVQDESTHNDEPGVGTRRSGD
jgi:hypothetical protein